MSPRALQVKGRFYQVSRARGLFPWTLFITGNSAFWVKEANTERGIVNEAGSCPPEIPRAACIILIWFYLEVELCYDFMVGHLQCTIFKLLTLREPYPGKNFSS